MDPQSIIQWIDERPLAQAAVLAACYVMLLIVAKCARRFSASQQARDHIARQPGTKDKRTCAETAENK